MNLKLVYMSVLMFGVGGLILFICRHTWIEDQLTVSEENFPQQTTNKDFRSHFTEEPEKATKPWVVERYLDKQSEGLDESNDSVEDPDLFLGTKEVFLEERQKILKQFKEVNLSSALHPLNSDFFRDSSWKTIDEVQERRRSFLHDFCKTHVNETRPRISLVRMVSSIYVEDKYKLLYCEVPKAGCSNWKRILMVLGGLAKSTANIAHYDVHYGGYLKKLDSYDLKEILRRLATYTKILFVRNPLERLVSAFRDKFEHPNNYYHPIVGKAIIKKYRLNADRQALTTGSGVKFQEFIQYLLDPDRPVGMDTHWEQINKLCYPCTINYDFIGKSETLGKDANYFLRLIDAPSELEFPDFKDRHSNDKRTSSEIVRQYLAEISATERQQIYDFYYLDYLMFNYTLPYVES